MLDQESPIGSALLFNACRLEQVFLPGEEQEQPSSKQVISRGSTNSSILTVCLRGKNGSPLQDILGPTVFASTHLDAMNEDQRVRQLDSILAATRAFGTRSCVVAGDMNTECRIGSAVSSMVAPAEELRAVSAQEVTAELVSALRIDAGSPPPSPEQIAEWAALRTAAQASRIRHRVDFLRVPTGPTRAAHSYDGSKTMETWKLDHVFFDHSTLELKSLWETLESDDFSSKAGLPNINCPSDHIPIAAVFRPRLAATPADADAASATAASHVEAWKAWEQGYASEVAQLKCELDAQQAALEERLGLNQPSSDAEGSSEKKKKGKKRKAKPPQEMIDFLGNRRRLLREKSKGHDELRAQRIAGLSDTVLDHLENVGELSFIQIAQARLSAAGIEIVPDIKLTRPPK